MLKTIYSRAFSVMLKKPVRLWAIGLLSSLLCGVANALFGIIPGVALCLCLLISVGLIMVYLHGYRGDEVKAVQLFDAFKDGATFKRTLCGMGWMLLWIFLWALIPFAGPVFAIIRAYQYRLTPYILVQEPDVAPTEAIKLSKERTKGYCGSMFLADLLPGVAIFVVALILGLLGMIPYVGVLFVIIDVLFVIVALLLVGLFKGLVQAAYYEEISNPSMNRYGEEVVVCPACGKPVVKGAAFCPGCGAKIEE